MRRQFGVLAGLIALAFSPCAWGITPLQLAILNKPPMTTVVTHGQKAMIGVGGTNQPFTTASTTYYLPINAIGGPNSIGSSLGPVTWHGAGSIINIDAKPTTNARAANPSATLCLDIAGVDVACKTWGSTDTTEWTATGPYTVNANDQIYFKLTTGTGSGNFVLRGVSAAFVTSGQIFNQFSSVGSVALSLSRPLSVCGSLNVTTGSNTDDTGGQIPALESATLSNLTIATVANASSSAKYDSRKNNANGAESVTIALNTGPITGTDGTNLDSISTVGPDNWAVRMEAAGASVTTGRVAIKYTGAVTGRTLVLACGSVGTLTTGNTYFGGPYGPPTTVNAGVEAPTDFVVPFNGHLTKPFVAALAGTTTTATFTFLDNGVATSCTVTYALTGAGSSVDPNTCNVAYTAGHTISWSIAGQSTGFNPEYVGFLFTDDNPS